MTTPEPRPPVRALSLLSGGLDSQLTICVLRDQGIHVEAVVFSSPFFKIGLLKRPPKS
jgi:tRNA U34 2-thiouridine synthase MnmA/TrmU